MTDEECIATAMLHGCEPWLYDGFAWYCRDRIRVLDHHPIEKAYNRVDPARRYFFSSREQLCRFYCEFYKLLPEVTNENVSLQRAGDDQHRSRSCEPG